MTEIGTTGIYEKTVTFESSWGRGDFSIVCSESTKGTMDAMTISVLRTDMEQVYGQVSSILGNTAGISGLRTVADSLNNQFAVIESVLSKVGKNLVAQVKEAASSALGLESIFTQLANVAKQVKQISGEAGINLEKLYQVSVDKKQDIDYLKNKTQQLKASVEMSTKMVDNIANKPITQTWYEYKK
jgi:archaellum component FlaC